MVGIDRIDVAPVELKKVLGTSSGTTRVMLLYARLGTGPGMGVDGGTGGAPVRNYFGPFFVWWTNPPAGRLYPYALCG